MYLRTQKLGSVVVLLALLFSVSVTGRLTCSTSQYSVTEGGDDLFGPVAADVFLAPEDAETVTVKIAKSLSVTTQLTDVYFLFDLSKEMTSAIQAFTSTGATPFGTIVTNMQTSNPDVHVGVGTFVNKPLGGIGWTDYHVYAPAQMLTNDVSALQNAVDIVATQTSIKDEPRKFRSSLEALFQVKKRETTLGFRTTARKIVIVVTNRPFNVEGDVMQYLINPDPLTSITIGSTTYPITDTFPTNDGDNDLEQGCTLSGEICICGVTMLSTTNEPGCKSCGPLSYELRQTGSLTNMPRGACEDYPSIATVTQALSEYEVWVAMTDSQQATAADAIVPWESFVMSTGSDVGVVLQEADLATVLPDMVTPPSQEPAVQHSSPAVDSVVIDTATELGQDYYLVHITFLLAQGNSVTGEHVFNIADYTTTIALDTCVAPTESATQTQSQSQTQTQSQTQSQSPTNSQSQSKSQSQTQSETPTKTPQQIAQGQDPPVQTLANTQSQTKSQSQSQSPTNSQSQSQTTVPNRLPSYTPPSGMTVEMWKSTTFFLVEYVNDPDDDILTFELVDMREIDDSYTSFALNGEVQLVDSHSGEVVFTATDYSDINDTQRRRETKPAAFAFAFTDGASSRRRRAEMGPANMFEMTIVDPNEVDDFDPETCANCVLNLTGPGYCYQSFALPDPFPSPCDTIEMQTETLDFELPWFPQEQGNGTLETGWLSINGTSRADCLAGMTKLEVLIGAPLGVLGTEDEIVVNFALDINPRIQAMFRRGIIPEPESTNCMEARKSAVSLFPGVGFQGADVLFVTFDQQEIQAARACGFDLAQDSGPVPRRRAGPVVEPGWFAFKITHNNPLTPPNAFVLADIDTGMCSADSDGVDITFFKFLLQEDDKKHGKKAEETAIIIGVIWGAMYVLPLLFLLIGGLAGGASSGASAAMGGSTSSGFVEQERRPLLSNSDKKD